jgi:hypothetical protein
MSEKDARPTPNDGDLAEVARVYGPFEADLIKSFLESYGIVSIVRGRSAPFIYPVTVDGMAELKIFVEKADRELAEELIAAMPSSDDENGPEDPV